MSLEGLFGSVGGGRGRRVCRVDYSILAPDREEMLQKHVCTVNGKLPAFGSRTSSD